MKNENDAHAVRENASAESLARRIRLLVLDVDGVLTDGGLYYDANGLRSEEHTSELQSQR